MTVNRTSNPANGNQVFGVAMSYKTQPSSEKRIPCGKAGSSPAEEAPGLGKERRVMH